MSVNNFIPEIWSGRVFQSLRKAHVFGDVVNRDYEGEISQAGDTVHINSLGPITIAAYTKNSTSITPETLADTDMMLKIDQADYFAFQVDNIDKRQAQADILSAGMDIAAYGLADTSDHYIAHFYSSAGSHANVTVTSLNVYESLLTASEVLSENNVPMEGRWAVLPPWYITKLCLAEVVLPSALDGTSWTNGKVARVAGFDVRISNNLVPDSTTGHYVMCGANRAISFAEQIASVEAYRPEAKFADAVKGLHLYGAKVIDPSALVCIHATEGTEA
jgi:hypothetical protein